MREFKDWKAIIDGSFEKLSPATQETVQEIHAHFHFRDGYKYEDGSMGTIRISPKQLRDLIAHVLTEGGSWR